jgi:hypothetical protein
VALGGIGAGMDRRMLKLTKEEAKSDRESLRRIKEEFKKISFKLS